MNLELDEPNCRCRRCRVDGDLSAVPVPLVPLSSPSRSDLSKNANLVSPRRFAGKADNDHHHLHGRHGRARTKMNTTARYVLLVLLVVVSSPGTYARTEADARVCR